MGQPTWREIKKVIVPGREASAWTPALDYVTPGKLYRIVVEMVAPETAAVVAQPPNAEVVAQPPNAEVVAQPPDAVVAQPPNAGVHAPEAALDPPALAGTLSSAATRSPSRDQHWIPESGGECTADGDLALMRSGALTLESCAAGALIAKIGGSTADVRPDKDKVVLFSAGRYCVFSIQDATKAGSLYLGMNDTKESVTRSQGQLEVTISEAL